MDDADGGGKTLGERVRALETNAGDAPTRDGTETSEKARSARGGEALNPSADDAAALAVAEALNGTKGAPPKADSSPSSSQALVAEDRALIERCLSVSDPTVVDNTTSRRASRGDAVVGRGVGSHANQTRARGTTRAVDAHGDVAPRRVHRVVDQGAGAARGVAADGGVARRHAAAALVAARAAGSPLAPPGGGDEDGNGDGDGDENGPVSTYDEGDEDVDVVEDALDDGDDSEDDGETDEDALDDGDDSEDEEDDSTSTTKTTPSRPEREPSRCRGRVAETVAIRDTTVARTETSTSYTPHTNATRPTRDYQKSRRLTPRHDVNFSCGSGSPSVR